MGASEKRLIYVRAVWGHKDKLWSGGFLSPVWIFLVLLVAVLWLVFSCAVAHEREFLSSLTMLLEHQQPLVIGVGRSSRKKKGNSFTFGLGFL